MKTISAGLICAMAASLSPAAVDIEEVVDSVAAKLDVVETYQADADVFVKG
ncbi:MAG: hypothetical protein GF418_01490 [Chitinivibrionales bacterium]|nr:hypothetical protein [Chitinivibrionales bacterium]MBD3394276.1 hypothetical protein [Chitinivibrionales bacterium]